MYSLSFQDNFDIVKGGRTNVVMGQMKTDQMDQMNQMKEYRPMTVWFTDLDVPGIILDDGFAIIHAKPDTESKYECVGDTHNTQQACESEYDGLGAPKTKSVWDKRCKHNTECPFYDADKNRGLCSDNGYCELPLGVKRVGYTRYRGLPFCHGCADPLNPTCCYSAQRLAPDYAFSYDYMERSNNRVEYFIPDKEIVSSSSPIHELNDADFQTKYFSILTNSFEKPIHILNNIKPTGTSSLFLNNSCSALLKLAQLEKYSYKFGKCDVLQKDDSSNLVYFTATVCIHGPAKEKGKVVRYDCQMENEEKFMFANVLTIGSISEDQLGPF